MGIGDKSLRKLYKCTPCMYLRTYYHRTISIKKVMKLDTFFKIASTTNVWWIITWTNKKLDTNSSLNNPLRAGCYWSDLHFVCDCFIYILKFLPCISWVEGLANRSVNTISTNFGFCKFATLWILFEIRITRDRLGIFVFIFFDIMPTFKSRATNRDSLTKDIQAPQYYT